MKKRPPLDVNLDLPVLDLGGVDGLDLGLPDTGLLPPADPEEQDDRPEVERAEGAVKEYESAFQARARIEQDRFTQAIDSEYWVCFCFETRAQKEEFLRSLLGLSDEDIKRHGKHLDGLRAAEVLGITLKSARGQWGKPRTNVKLAEMAKRR